MATRSSSTSLLPWTNLSDGAAGRVARQPLLGFAHCESAALTWPETRDCLWVSPSCRAPRRPAPRGSSVTRASRTSSLRERPSNSGARFSACTFVSWLKSRTRLAYSGPLAESSGEQLPLAGHALELPHPAVLELDTRAGRE